MDYESAVNMFKNYLVIIIDSNDNVFGQYLTGVTGASGFSVGGFIFTLNSNGRCGIEKYDYDYECHELTEYSFGYSG